MCVLDAQLCLTLCNPMDCSSPGSSVHGILQARILEWVAVSFSKTNEYIMAKKKKKERKEEEAIEPLGVNMPMKR